MIRVTVDVFVPENSAEAQLGLLPESEEWTLESAAFRLVQRALDRAGLVDSVCVSVTP